MRASMPCIANPMALASSLIAKKPVCINGYKMRSSGQRRTDMQATSYWKIALRLKQFVTRAFVWTMIPACSLAATSCASSPTRPSSAGDVPNTNVKLLIPAYYDSGGKKSCAEHEGYARWLHSGLMERATIVLNGHDGPPTTEPEKAFYQACIAEFKEKKAKVLGYVHTKCAQDLGHNNFEQFAIRPKSNVDRDAATWLDMKVDGIFFDEVTDVADPTFGLLQGDECPSTPNGAKVDNTAASHTAHLAFYEERFTNVRSIQNDAIIWLNSGAAIRPAYLNAANGALIFEGDFKEKWNCSGGKPGPFCAYDKDDDSIKPLQTAMKTGAITSNRLAAALRNVPISDVSKAVADATSQGVEVIYLEEPGVEAWQQAPSPKMLAAIQGALGVSP